MLFCDTDTENIETIQKRVTEVFCQEGFEYADKVQFGAISTVLKPDKLVRFSIKDKIIRTKYKKIYMKIPEFEVLYTFLEENLKYSAENVDGIVKNKPLFRAAVL